MPNNWKSISYFLITLLIGIFVGFAAFTVWDTSHQSSNIPQFEIIQDVASKGKTIKTRLDSLANIKLQYEIQLVEKKNDGRFEVLTWSSVLVLTLLLVFITVNFIISSAKVRELVDIEIEKKTDEIKKKTDSLIEIYEAKFKEISKLENELGTKTAEAEKVFEEMKKYNEASGKLKNKDNGK